MELLSVQEEAEPAGGLQLFDEYAYGIVDGGWLLTIDYPDGIPEGEIEWLEALVMEAQPNTFLDDGQESGAPSGG